jgi:hypothetical protein
LHTVAALYTLTPSIYDEFPEVDVWNEARHARLYAGPHPIVAHSPCAPWGNYSNRNKHHDPETAKLALQQVERWGGVWEHPVTTKAALALGICDRQPGWTITGWNCLLVNQFDWGHVARKRTMLLIYPKETPIPPMPPPCMNRRPRPVEHLTHRERAATPRDFAAWLIDLARGAQR